MSTGCIHGRFQPFHNGHFEYLQRAYALSERLIIGITQYDPVVEDSGSPSHRLDIIHNPFSYWERAELIRAAVRRGGLEETRTVIVPFPIHDPRMISSFVEHDCIMYTTIYEMWNIEKIRRLRRQGFKVEILWRRRVKQFEGRVVREAMRADRSWFELLVPQGVFETLANPRFAPNVQRAL
jgi:cytidyltransferase-like protein